MKFQLHFVFISDSHLFNLIEHQSLTDFSNFSSKLPILHKTHIKFRVNKNVKKTKNRGKSCVLEIST